MGVELRVLMVIAMVIALTTAASATSGTATYYTRPYTPSACHGYEGKGVMIGGASNSIWDNRKACGRIYSVRCKGPANEYPHPCLNGTITVTIVDHCSACNGTINLSQDAFAKIADLEAGKIKVEYNLTAGFEVDLIEVSSPFEFEKFTMK